MRKVPIAFVSMLVGSSCPRCRARPMAELPERGYPAYSGRENRISVRRRSWRSDKSRSINQDEAVAPN